jgi:hypothetical protein
MYGWRIYHTVFDAWYSPDVPKGVMVRHEAAATWTDREQAALVCAQLNVDSNRSTLDAMVHPWISSQSSHEIEVLLSKCPESGS